MPYLLHQLLQRSAERTPLGPAVCHHGAALSYAQLETQSNQLAAILLQAGVQRGDRIGIYLDKSLAAIVAIFAILKTGAAYVPLDPAAPAARIAYIVQNCRMAAIVSTVAKMSTLQQSAPTNLTTLRGVIVADENPSDLRQQFPFVAGWSEVLAAPTDPPAHPGVIENDLAYVLYTSGSTGTPKGVMISHRASLTFVEWASTTFAITPDDRVSNHAPLHFDLSILDIFATIHAGATVVLVPATHSVFPRTLADFMAREKISIWYSVPSILTSLVLYGQLERHSFPRLRAILFAGEVFPIKYLRRLMELVSHPRYFNLFGPTETNVCTYYEVPPLAPERTAPLSIGKAIDNYELFVLDEQGAIAAPGVEGELCARGPGIMTGYWGLPERTAQSRILFTCHPDLGPEIMYHTGDWVRLENDGNYTYLGRRDGMIKSRGYRIEIGEIESTLHNHPEVVEAAVVPVPDEEIGNRIKAFVATRDGSIPAAALAAYCESKLPKYMVPHYFEFRSVLPKTSTGKIDRTTLMKDQVA
ncbi:MAG TPA: amino acid adenylation domain-containing protein [Polyangium sp.]|nr:amino acid adenylation domain-containing protein [Polyangium sp.]